MNRAEDRDMLIQSLKRHFPARQTEWINSGVLVTWGAYLVLHPEIFVNDPTAFLFRGLVDFSDQLGYPPASIWGMGALIIGMLQACALFINGAYTRTPIIRLIVSFVSAFIWTQVVAGLMKSGIPNVGIVIYGWFVVMNLSSAYRAAVDVVYAEKQRHDSIMELGGRGRNCASHST